MLLHSYVIPLDPRTKKNHQEIRGSGPKCPVCKKPARQFVAQSGASSKFAFDAARFLQPKPSAPIDSECHIIIRCFMQTKRRVDDLNLWQNIMDIMVHEGIIADDNIRIVRSRDGSGVWYDKENPRVEIEIHDMEGCDAYALNG